MKKINYDALERKRLRLIKKAEKLGEKIGKDPSGYRVKLNPFSSEEERERFKAKLLEKL